MRNDINRREFLKLMGVGVGGALLASTGYTTSVLAAQASAPAAANHEYSTQREGKMNGRILVAYASRSGSTSEVAEKIADTLSKRRVEVDLMQAKNVKELSAYRMVVAGSGVYMGRWFPEAVNFVKRNQSALSRLPVAYFSVCLTMVEDTPEKRAEAARFTEPLRQLVKPFSETWFAGKMESAKLPFYYKWVMQMTKTPDGDYRNWPEIQAWAASLL